MPSFASEARRVLTIDRRITLLTRALPIGIIVVCALSSGNPIAFLLVLILLGIIGFLTLTAWCYLTGVMGCQVAFIAVLILLVVSLLQGNWIVFSMFLSLCAAVVISIDDWHLLESPVGRLRVTREPPDHDHWVFRVWYGLWSVLFLLIVGSVLLQTGALVGVIFGVGLLTAAWSMVVFVFSFFKL